MDPKSKTKRALVFALICCAFAISTSRLHASLTQADCVGKVYGTPGCPLKPIKNTVRPPLCGDAVLNDDEECDLGRFNGLTNCTANCTLLYCGDGVLSPFLGEACEPLTEEVYAEDPETGALYIEVRFMTLSCGETCTAPSCAENGVCTGGCELTTTNQCVGQPYVLPVELEAHSAAPPPVPLIPTLSNKPAETIEVAAAAVCGNGVKEEDEECDDGNFNNADECPNNCKNPVCGNKVREGKEECDDGNNSNMDACTNECTNAACGDGIIQTGEECDNGRKNSDKKANACRMDCTKAICGDGVIDKGEQCDAGKKNSDKKANMCRKTCSKPRCGDGVKDNGEECDDGNDINGDDCSNACKKPVCGDGIHQDGEQCDGGKNNSDTVPNMCRTNCAYPHCGDGVHDDAEQCDDGNKNNKDECTTECIKTFCGDGAIQDGEECDDGNNNNEDECIVGCKLAVCGDGYVQLDEECDAGEENSDETPDACRVNCTSPICGDAVVDSGEECDGTDDCTEECLKKHFLILLVKNGNFLAGVAGVVTLFFIGGIIALAVQKSRAPKPKQGGVASTPPTPAPQQGAYLS